MERQRPKHIGIVGCSAEGAALCYRTICEEGERFLGERYAHPEVTMHTFSFAEYVKMIEAGDWDGIAELMLASAEKVARAGAEFAICPDNTVHIAFDKVAARSPIPWLHIAEEVAREAKSKGYKRVGVMGTRFLVESSVYPEKLEAFGIEAVIPEEADRELVNRIIFDELVCGKFLPESRARLCEVVERLKARGCEAVVLGCTELPLIVTPDVSPLPVLDSTRILARAALREATGKSPDEG